LKSVPTEEEEVFWKTPEKPSFQSILSFCYSRDFIVYGGNVA